MSDRSRNKHWTCQACTLNNPPSRATCESAWPRPSHRQFSRVVRRGASGAYGHAWQCALPQETSNHTACALPSRRCVPFAPPARCRALGGGDGLASVGRGGGADRGAAQGMMQAAKRAKNAARRAQHRHANATTPVMGTVAVGAGLPGPQTIGGGRKRQQAAGKQRAKGSYSDVGEPLEERIADRVRNPSVSLEVSYPGRQPVSIIASTAAGVKDPRVFSTYPKHVALPLMPSELENGAEPSPT